MKKIEDTFIRFDMIHERDGLTQRHRTTAGGRAYESIALQKLAFFDQCLA